MTSMNSMPNPPFSFSFEPAHNSLSFFFFSLLLHPTFTGYIAFPLHKLPPHRAPFSFSSIFLCSPRLIHLQFKVTVTKKRERRTKMNRCAYQYHQQQQKASAMVGFGCVSELRRGENCSNTFSMANTNGVVCPKPRRIVNNNFNDSISIIRPSRFLHNNNQQMEACESKAGIELLDIIRPKGDYGFEKSSYQVASSPPFYNGSPPVRASNPLIQDEQFGNEKLLSPLSPSPSVDPPTAAGGRGRVSYRHNQPNVRVEGFNCSVYAIA